MTCTATTASNAYFSSVLVGETSGACNTGYSGTVKRTCLFNSTTSQGYWSSTTGACTRTFASRRAGPNKPV